MVCGLLGLLLAACSTVPTGAPRQDGAAAPPAGAPPAPDMRPVSATLLAQSRAQLRDGNSAQAAATLERAIRIDPGEPAVWLALARLRYTEGNWQQAEQLARKAKSLAARGSAVRSAAEQVIGDALLMQGQPRGG